MSSYFFSKTLLIQLESNIQVINSGIKIKLGIEIIKKHTISINMINFKYLKKNVYITPMYKKSIGLEDIVNFLTFMLFPQHRQGLASFPIGAPCTVLA